ncbi:ABC transporter ATP-binding protein [Inconstantimicrobium mannanitabidum]|uniref:Bacitracin ABC transporter ATP-binding protein n=1 Tax=Inconstantimicrobium mannanitabidum TaxID=1604901 RepID=A0ACB5R7R7_9CLOT|nr:ABC transporter ATP-binding protein [Clostridium sp. TW13]GKX64996.1 bacitracin ABC transporter ATP-binding protein [Clostridium sp. TW13]
MEYVLRTTKLTKIFNGKDCVSDVNINIKKGEIYGLLGPNGAGKTTIMRMITNLIKPTAGEIEILGEKLTNESYEVFKRIGAIIEYPVFYDKLTARENLELHLEYLGYYDKSAIDKALKLVELEDTGSKKVKDFSLGMKQRLGIARAISTKPEFLILDEPINGLDPVGIRKVRELLKMLSREYGMTILLSSHILSEMEKIADTIGILDNTKLVKEVPVEAIRNANTEYVEIITSDLRKACYVLSNDLGISNFKLLDDDCIRIYDLNLSQNQISKALILSGVNIESILRKKSSLEDYFIKTLEEDAKNA